MACIINFKSACRLTAPMESELMSFTIIEAFSTIAQFVNTHQGLDNLLRNDSSNVKALTK